MFWQHIYVHSPLTRLIARVSSFFSKAAASGSLTAAFTLLFVVQEAMRLLHLLIECGMMTHVRSLAHTFIFLFLFNCPPVWRD